nr:hypothetical protein FFPRI1PSEUD_27780 [Pseudomonas sp. FFPRI_1]
MRGRGAPVCQVKPKAAAEFIGSATEGDKEVKQEPQAVPGLGRRNSRKRTDRDGQG